MKLLGRLSVMCVLGVFVYCMAACETTAGAGRDIQNLGESIEDAAD